MGDNFFKDLASAKSREQAGGSYIFPNQTGTLLLHGIIKKQTGYKTSVILLGEIVKASPRTPGAPVQEPGTLVKNIWVLSSQAFKIEQLKTALVEIMGITKDTSENDIEEAFAAAFDGGLKGVLCGFETWTKRTKEKQIDITNTKYTHLDEQHGNSEKEISERAAKIADVE